MDNSDTITESTINFIILGCSFYLSCFLLSIKVERNVIIQTFIYACVVLLAVAIGKRILSANLTSAGRVVKTIIINATGLFIGAIIMLIFGYIFPELGEYTVAVVLASVMAFFVFGTLSPLLRSDRHSLL
jgi:VIT1/CCC1 family predicted Fe2+/Mn2+ transporter